MKWQVFLQPVLSFFKSILYRFRETRNQWEHITVFSPQPAYNFFIIKLPHNSLRHGHGDLHIPKKVANQISSRVSLLFNAMTWISVCRRRVCPPYNPTLSRLPLIIRKALSIVVSGIPANKLTICLLSFAGIADVGIQKADTRL